MTLLWVEISKWKAMLNTLPLLADIQRMTSELVKSSTRCNAVPRLADTDLTATCIRPASPLPIYMGKIKLDKTPVPMQESTSLK